LWLGVRLRVNAGGRRARDNLYHVLNHLNLFGGSYREKAEVLIDRLLAAAGHQLSAATESAHANHEPSSEGGSTL